MSSWSSALLFSLLVACSEKADPVSPESDAQSGGGSGGSGGYGYGGTSNGGNAGASAGGTSGAGGGTGGSAGRALACADAELCDDFENASVGGPPAAPWQVVSPDCSGTGVLAIDDTQAHGGSHSVKVSGAGGFCNHVFLKAAVGSGSAAGARYGRFWLRLGSALTSSHVTFVALTIPSDASDLRMGGQNSVLMWNRESDDATLPAMSPAGTAESVALPVDTWTCIEFGLDGQTGHIETWVDGSSVLGLVVDDTPTPDVDEQWLSSKPDYVPAPSELQLGWESYGGDENTLFIDDVAFADQRIGCDALP